MPEKSFVDRASALARSLRATVAPKIDRVGAQWRRRHMDHVFEAMLRAAVAQRAITWRAHIADAVGRGAVPPFGVDPGDFVARIAAAESGLVPHHIQRRAGFFEFGAVEMVDDDLTFLKRKGEVLPLVTREELVADPAADCAAAAALLDHRVATWGASAPGVLDPYGATKLVHTVGGERVSETVAALARAGVEPRNVASSNFSAAYASTPWAHAHPHRLRTGPGHNWEPATPEAWMQYHLDFALRTAWGGARTQRLGRATPLATFIAQEREVA